MTRILRSAALYSISLAAALLLGACGKHESAPPAAPSATASTATVPAPSAPMAATSVKAPASGSSAITSAATAASVMNPAAVPPTTTLSVASLTVGDAVDANHRITHPAKNFASSDNTLYASVDTAGSSTGATLNAKWSYLEGQGQLVSSISQSIATEGPAVTTFKVKNPDLWPEGKYQVEILLDGKSVARQDFEIGKS